MKNLMTEGREEESCPLRARFDWLSRRVGAVRDTSSDLQEQGRFPRRSRPIQVALIAHSDADLRSRLSSDAALG